MGLLDFLSKPLAPEEDIRPENWDMSTIISGWENVAPVKEGNMNEFLQLITDLESSGGQDDYQEVGKKQSQGWEFVTPDEVPEMGATSVVREEGRYAGVVCRGDIALGKIPTVKLEAKRRHYRNKANEMLEAVNSQLMSQSNSRMPISNNSKSRTFKGRSPTFQD